MKCDEIVEKSEQRNRSNRCSHVAFRRSFVLLLLSFFTPFFACVDEIDLNVDTEERTLVIDGFVSDLLGSHRVKLSLSSVIGIGNDNILSPVPGATVKLLDNTGGSFSYMELENGVYELSSFEALRNTEYFIDVVLADGRHYQSIPEKLRASSLITSVSYDITEQTLRNNIGEFEKKTVISLKLGTDVSGSEEPPFLRWRVEGEYALSENYPGALNTKTCYIPTRLDINDVRIFNTSKLEDGKLFDQIIAETEYNYRFAEQFCFHLFQFSISEDEFNYWDNIKEIIDIDGGLFDPPPGTLIGNVRNIDDVSDIAVGYFSVASISFERQFINALELNYFVDTWCRSRFRRDIPFGCTECTDIQMSESARPAYWEF